MTGPSIGDEELIVHAFFVLDEVTGERPYQRIRAMWEACRPLMGRPIVGAGLPVHLPADPADLPDESVVEAVIAGQESAGGDFQAVLRRRHDVLNLSLAFAAARMLGWAEFERRWEGVLAGAGDALLGEARIYYGTIAGADRLPVAPSVELTDAVRRALPSVPQEPEWWVTGTTIGRGFPIWEISPRDDARALRRIVVLTPEECDAELSAWVWSAGDPGAPPFARYLLHAAKLRYQVRVWDRGRGLGRLRARSAETVARLSAEHADTQELRDVELDVASALAALPAMKHTVEIAADNLARNLALFGTAGGEHDLFGDDRTLAATFPVQLDDEIAYLDTDRELLLRARDILTGRPVRNGATRTESGGEPTIGILTAMPLELHAMRSLLEDVRDASVPRDAAFYVSGTLPSRDDSVPHRVILAQTGATGNNAAADAATNLSRSFPTVDCLIMTGIAAGVPNPGDPARHVRLGDIVLATWGIVDYDHVVVRDGQVELRQTFPRPWPMLSRVADQLEADEHRGLRPWERWLDISGRPDLAAYARPPEATDVLEPADADAHTRRPRHPRRASTGHRAGWPKVHKGRIGSANASLRDGRLRDMLAAQHNLRAVEMEGAGLGTSAFLNDRHWFMVRGISDYADRSFNSRWRNYAALAAASYVRALLAACHPIPAARH